MGAYKNSDTEDAISKGALNNKNELLYEPIIIVFLMKRSECFRFKPKMCVLYNHTKTMEAQWTNFHFVPNFPLPAFEREIYKTWSESLASSLELKLKTLLTFTHSIFSSYFYFTLLNISVIHYVFLRRDFFHLQNNIYIDQLNTRALFFMTHEQSMNRSG